MIKSFSIIIISTLMLLSCTEHKNSIENVVDKSPLKTTSSKKPKEIIESKKENRLEVDLLINIEPFIDSVLNKNKRRHEFGKSNKKNIKHLDFFKKEGLQKIVAFSDKRYPKKTEPNYYEQFILFVLKYENREYAISTYNELKRITQLDYKNTKNLEEKEQIRSIQSSIKSGGMVCQKGNYIFSLVETCRETPIGGKWEEYENLFLEKITKNEEEIVVLNANCGQMKYTEEKRKPMHN